MAGGLSVGSTSVSVAPDCAIDVSSAGDWAAVGIGVTDGIGAAGAAGGAWEKSLGVE